MSKSNRFFVFLGLFLISMSVFAVGGADQDSQGEESITLMTTMTTYEGWPLYLDAAEQATGLSIDVVPTPTDTDARQQKITTMLSSGDTSIDVFYINDEMISAFKNTGWLQPLQDDVMTPDVVEEFVAQDYIDDMITSREGDILTVPFYRGMLAFWVNQEILDEVGLDIPTNMDEFREVAIATTGNGRYGYGGSWEKTYVFNEIGTFVNLFGGDYYDWTNPRNREAMQFIYDMANTWQVTPISQLAEKYEQMNQRIIDDKVTMWFMWGAGDDYRAAGKYGEDQIHIAQMPEFVTRSAFADSWGHAISVTSENKEAAYKFLQYTASKEGNIEAWNRLYRYPSRKDAESDPNTDFGDIKEIYGTYAETTALRGRPMLPQTMEFITDMGTIFQLYIQDRMTLDEFCENAQAYVERYQ